MLEDIKKIQMGFPLDENNFVALLPRLVQYKTSDVQPCVVDFMDG